MATTTIRFRAMFTGSNILDVSAYGGLEPYTNTEGYPDVVYVTSGHDTEIRLTLGAMIDLVSALAHAGAGGPAVDRFTPAR